MTESSPLTALVSRHVRHDDADPFWPDRDRVVVCGGADPTIQGPPGLAFGAAVGMAMVERLLAGRFGRSLVDHRTWLLADAEELAAGTAHEAAAVAGAALLGRLIVLAIVPPAESRPLARFIPLGWNVRKLEALDPKAVDSAVSAAQRSQKPTLIFCASAHPTSDAPAAFAHGASARRAWLKRLRRHAQSEPFHATVIGRIAVPWPPPAGGAATPADAVAAAIGRVAQALPELFLLPPEPGATPLAEPTSLKHLSWAGRGQAQAAALLGAGLHGGVLPVGRFSLRDAEAARPALRAAAALNLRGVHLLTEAGSACRVGGLRAGWRSMRDVLVLRPANEAEAEECLALALRRTDGPSVLLLADGAAALPQTAPRACAHGGYLVIEPPRRDATLVTAGPELHLALHLQAMLAKQGLHVAVASLPCWSLFAGQDASYRAAVLGDAPRIGLEAGTGAGWSQFLGLDGLFVDTAQTTDAAMLLPAVLRHLRRMPAHPAERELSLESFTAID